MFKKVNLGKQISLTLTNKIGVLADISKILAETGINIEAVAGYAKDNKNEAEIMLLTNNNSATIETLKKKGYKSFKETEVIIAELENKAGALKEITSKMALEGIDIKYIYGTTCSGSCPARLVISTNDNKKAIVFLSK